METFLGTLGGAVPAYIAELITITLADGTVLDYCTGEKNITLAGTTFIANAVLPIIESIGWKIGVEVDTCKMSLWAAGASSTLEIFIQDSGGGLWEIGINPDGTLRTDAVTGVTPQVIKLNDSSGASWQLTVSTLGILNTTAIAAAAYPTSFQVEDYRGVSWNVGVNTSGLLTSGPNSNSSTQFILQSIVQGIFDNAQIVVQRILSATYGDTTNGAITIFAGYVSDIPLADGAHAELDIKSRKELLNIPLPYRTYQPSCRWTLYDDNCTLSAAAFQVNATLAAGSGQLLFNTTLANPDQYFDQGYLIFTSGRNTGLKRTVRSYLSASGQILLFIPLPNTVATGDAFTIFPGCSKTMSVCQNTFGNLVHFGGMPYIPTPESSV